MGLFDAYLIENDRVGVGCVFEHEFTAAAAKRMTHLNIILRILTLRYDSVIAECRRAVTLTNLVQIPIPHGKSSDIRRQYLEYVFRRQQVML